MKIITKDGYSLVVDSKDAKRLLGRTLVTKFNKGMRRVVVYLPKRNDPVPIGRFLLNASGGQVVDHISHDQFDNRRSNLRLCSHAENMYNKTCYKNSKTGVKGVFKKGNKYCAQLRKMGKIHLQTGFSTILEAKIAYEEMAKKHFGSFAHLA